MTSAKRADTRPAASLVPDVWASVVTSQMSSWPPRSMTNTARGARNRPKHKGSVAGAQSWSCDTRTHVRASENVRAVACMKPPQSNQSPLQSPNATRATDAARIANASQTPREQQMLQESRTPHRLSRTHDVPRGSVETRQSPPKSSMEHPRINHESNRA